MANQKSSLVKRAKNLQVKSYLSIFLSLILITLGAWLILFSNTYGRSNFSLERSSKKEVSVYLAQPIKLFIPRLSKTLKISDGFVTDDRWMVSETGVSFLTTSAVPGNGGNSVLYGHNRVDILGKLWKVTDGDLVYVILSDGSFAKYRIFETKEVAPNQVEILDHVGDSRLTIYTCSGFLDSARFVVVGELVVSS